MKRSFLAFFGSILLFSACLKDTVKESYTFYRPVYHTRDEVKSNIKSSAPGAIVQTGKIVVKDHYLFLNEIDEGIHVIDIADPAKPVNLAFIAIPGCVDLAINGNYLYADCYTDLVTLDITNPASVLVKQFINGVFPRRFYSNFKADTTKVIKSWVRVDTTVSRRFSQTFTNSLLTNNLVYMSASGMLYSASSAAKSAAGIAISGSLARFALQNNRMYAVNNNELKVFNTTSADAPKFVSTLALADGDIETIFPYKNKLFIGGQAGMYIYEASNPDAPTKFSKFTHARSCDPVIADDKYAYVTLSGGSACGGFSNQLDVIDLSNIANPTLIKSYPLTSPKGLSIDGPVLLVCDGKDGLKIFNAANPNNVTLLQKVPGFEPTDVIALGGYAIAVAKDGIYLVNYSNPASAAVVGKIQVAAKK
jgi:hypothetical protein